MTSAFVAAAAPVVLQSDTKSKVGPSRLQPAD